MNLLNAGETSGQPITRACICPTLHQDMLEFHVFFRQGVAAPSPSTWGWKKATTIADVTNFLNGIAPYSNSIGRAEIAGVWKDLYREFYIFYRSGSKAQPKDNWSQVTYMNENQVLAALNSPIGYPSAIIEGMMFTALQTPSGLVLNPGI